LREQSWWDAKAAKEDIDLADEAINRALRWREIDRHHTILPDGTGTRQRAGLIAVAVRDV
jgi:hypothetical protein